MNLASVFDAVVDMVEDIPFGNSDFQNRLVIVDEEQTPLRAARHAGLRIIGRLEALKEAYFNLRKNEIEIKILQQKMQKETDFLAVELLSLEIERRQFGMSYGRKLIKDAIKEIEGLLPILLAQGKITKQAFEKEEHIHYQLKHPDIKVPDFENDLYASITRIPLNDITLLEAIKRLEDFNADNST